MHCEKCRTDVLKSVTKLPGIDDISIDLEKQTLVVIGDVDPVSVVERVRKAGKRADIVTVGPPKKQDPPPPPPPPPPACQVVYPACPDVYPACSNVYPSVVGYPPPCETGGCVIL